MPKKDGTGPRGKGPLTGKGQGFCILQLTDSKSLLKQTTDEEVVQMPGGNGMGPIGSGPMTGRGAGYCAGFNSPGYVNLVPGRGMGYGRGLGRGAGLGRGLGRGRGRGLGWRATGAYGYGTAGSGIPVQEEAGVLRNQVQFMQEEMDAINRRIKELESEQGPE